MDAHKYTQRETPTNLVRQYRKSAIGNIADIEALISKIEKSESFEIKRVSILDTSPNSSTGWVTPNIDAGAGTLDLAALIQKHRADFMSIEVEKAGTWAWVSVDMQSWTVTLSAAKTNPAVLDDFAKEFGF